MIVFRIEGKIFLHLPLEYVDPRIAIKLPPEKGIELRERYDAVRPAYHMNKTHWNDIFIAHAFSVEQ
ncbi:MAG: MmcQ/YjbR family DNA-binding protein, partial [Bacteroidales bacterium]|nr:MmcQ/YjbR family DNA-binding protein [Bacteroidales bacterium]